MADVITTATTQAVFIPEVWSQEAQIARESSLVMGQLVRRFDVDMARYGDILHIPFVSNLTGGDISTSDGTLASEAPTETEVTLTINKWKGVVIKVLDIVMAQNKYDFRKLYTDRMGYRLGQLLEQDLTALGTGLSQNVGTYNTDPTDANFRRAVQYLDDARAPFPDRHWVIKPAVKNVILGMDKFVRQDATGSGKPITSGQVPMDIYGGLVHVSPEVYKSGNNTSNMLIHRDCLALAVQKGIKTENFARTAFLDSLGASQLYGVIELRDDHGVEVKS